MSRAVRSRRRPPPFSTSIKGPWRSEMGRLANAPVILASSSATRRRLLENAGVDFEVLPAEIDEVEIRDSMQAERAEFAEIGRALAELKAVRISRNHGATLVI